MLPYIPYMDPMGGVYESGVDITLMVSHHFPNFFWRCPEVRAVRKDASFVPWQWWMAMDGQDQAWCCFKCLGQLKIHISVSSNIACRKIPHLLDDFHDFSNIKPFLYPFLRWFSHIKHPFSARSSQLATFDNTGGHLDTASPGTAMFVRHWDCRMNGCGPEHQGITIPKMAVLMGKNDDKPCRNWGDTFSDKFMSFFCGLSTPCCWFSGNYPNQSCGVSLCVANLQQLPFQHSHGNLPMCRWFPNHCNFPWLS